MSVDLVRHLRHLVSLNEPQLGGPYMGSAATACVDAMAQAADEIERLSRWKAEAAVLLDMWAAVADEAYGLLGAPVEMLGVLGPDVVHAALAVKS